MVHKLQIFSGLEEILLEEINSVAQLVTFQRGETLFYGNQLQRYFYIVTKGRVKAYQLNLHNAREQTIFIFSKGDMFDTITLLDDEPHDVMYEALEEGEVMQLPMEKVREWITIYPQFNRKFFPYLAAQMRHTEELATDLSLHTTSQRLVKLLLHQFSQKENNDFSLLDNLSHSEIAKLIGTVRHVVERHLHTLKEEGLIAQEEKKHLTITNYKKLLEKYY